MNKEENITSFRGNQHSQLPYSAGLTSPGSSAVVTGGGDSAQN